MAINLRKILPILRVLVEMLETFNKRKKNPIVSFSEFISKLGGRGL